MLVWSQMLINHIIAAEETGWTGNYQKLVASDGAAQDNFGRSVSISADGNIAVVGAWKDDDKGSDSGSAYIFVKSGGVWTQRQKLIAADGAAGDWFGAACSISADGDIIAIGAFQDDDGRVNTGSVYVFIRSGDNWIQQQKLVINYAGSGINFGYSIDVSDDGGTMVIGARHDDIKGSYSGSAYVFVRSGNGWIQQQILFANDAARDDYFGYSVGISADGDVVVVGALAGAAYVFVRSGDGWIQQQKLIATNGSTQDYFGISVDISADGNTILVGAQLDDEVRTNSGAAYVFVRSGDSWIHEQKLMDGDIVSGAYFGNYVRISADGNTAVIGAHLDDDKGTDSGSAYIFIRSGSSWSMRQKLTDPNGARYKKFGESVDVSADGNTVAVGTYSDDNGYLSGSVFIFT